MGRDRRAEQRIRDDVEREWPEHIARASKRVGEMLRDEGLWSERTKADMTALKLLEWNQAEKRAKQLSEAPARVFGVVVVPAAVTDKSAWEREARAIEAEEVKQLAARKGPPNDGVFEEEILGRSGVAEIPGELGSDIRQGQK